MRVSKFSADVTRQTFYTVFSTEINAFVLLPLVLIIKCPELKRPLVTNSLFAAIYFIYRNKERALHIFNLYLQMPDHL